MKLIKSISFLVLITIPFILNSCSNEPIDPTLDLTAGNSSYYVKFKMDGVQKTYTTTQASFMNVGPMGTASIVGIEGLNSMNLHVMDQSVTVIGEGTYPLQWTNVGCEFTEGTANYSSDYQDFTTSSGNIVIVEKNTTNKTVKGTFNFVGKNTNMTQTRNFTEGEFFVRYE
jgi:Family of unknown function (DUF6252)